VRGSYGRTFVAMIATEAEAVGKFVGDCISTPTVQAGTLLSVLGYMLYTEPLLGLVVLLIALPQVLIVAMIQRRINTLVRERTPHRAPRRRPDRRQYAGQRRICRFSRNRGRRGIRNDLWGAPARVQAQIRAEIPGRRNAVGGSLLIAICRRDHGSQRKDRNRYRRPLSAGSIVSSIRGAS
jgi:hypothetical protein